ncbi:hypothetical protein ACHAP7_009562 [Fusarium lateritium]
MSWMRSSITFNSCIGIELLDKTVKHVAQRMNVVVFKIPDKTPPVQKAHVKNILVNQSSKELDKNGANHAV